jgi:hypothetical protein
MSDHATTIASAVRCSTRATSTVTSTPCTRPRPCSTASRPRSPPIATASPPSFLTGPARRVPEATISAQDLFTDGDRVAVRFTVTGSHTGELFGVNGLGLRSTPRASPSCASPVTAASNSEKRGWGTVNTDALDLEGGSPSCYWPAMRPVSVGRMRSVGDATIALPWGCYRVAVGDVSARLALGPKTRSVKAFEKLPAGSC